MNYRKAVLAVLVSSVCGSALAAPPRIDLSSLDGAVFTSRFIVKYRNDSAERIQPALRQRALDAATTRAAARMAGPAARSGALRVGTLRTAQGGRHVLTTSRRLDRSQAEALMREIAADSNVEYIAVDAMSHPAALPNDPLLATLQMWHYGAGKGGAYVTQAWDAGATGAGVVVAVLDSGVTPHADLIGNLLPGYDFITDTFVSRRTTNDRAPGAWDLGDWKEEDGECGPDSVASNSSWHGTHVAGTIAEVTNNGKDGAGVAPQAKILPVRVLGRCGGYVSDISDAIVWAAGGHVEGVEDNTVPAEVINLSLGALGACPVMYQDAINQAVSLGTTVVVAAGNQNVDAANFNPANCANVVAVAATGYSGTRASYSDYGTTVDLSAPGGGGTEGTPNGFIWSTFNSGARQPVASPDGDIIQGYTGTSMAAPHVAGTVALIQSVAPTPLTPAQVESLLVASARPFPNPPPAARPIGSGILNAAVAVDLARKFGLPIIASPLISGIAERVAPIATGQSVLYSIDVPADKSRLDLLTYGGQGTATLLVQSEAEPTPSLYRARSARPGTNQAITIYAPQSGRYYVKVMATADSAGMYIRALVQ